MLQAFTEFSNHQKYHRGQLASRKAVSATVFLDHGVTIRLLRRKSVNIKDGRNFTISWCLMTFCGGGSEHRPCTKSVHWRPHACADGTTEEHQSHSAQRADRHHKGGLSGLVKSVTKVVTRL